MQSLLFLFLTRSFNFSILAYQKILVAGRRDQVVVVFSQVFEGYED